MSNEEIKNFVRDTIGSLASLTALSRFNRQLVARSYSDLYEWYITHMSGGSDEVTFRRCNAQINSADANDSCINYFFNYAVQSANVQNLVHCLDSYLVQILLRANDYAFTAPRLGLLHNSINCFSAQSSVLVVLVPLHNERSAHWSTLAFFRIQRNLSAWYAVHYDTSNSLNEKQSQLFCDRLKYAMRNDIDKTVEFYHKVLQAAYMYAQPDTWSCGYRSSVMALLISRITGACAIELDVSIGDKDDDESKAIAMRLTNHLREHAERDLCDDACARFLAEAIDHARSFELVDCVRGRLKNI